MISLLGGGATAQAEELGSVRAFFGDPEDLETGDDALSAAVAVPCTRAALAGMYGELAPRVHRFLRDLLGDPALASDATQETFVRAFRRVDELPRGTRIEAWTFGVARFVALEARKARGRLRRVIDDGAPVDDRTVDTRGRSPEAQLLEREAVRVVACALARLSEERRAALLLRCDHGLAYGEIATVMGWSLSKSKVEIFRAREVLRAALTEYRGGGS